MRRTVSLLLAGMLTVSLTGCGGGENIADAVGTEETGQEEALQEEEELPVRSRTGERLEEIQESGVLLIGISPDYAPFAFEEERDGKTICAGSDVALGDYIAEELGVEARYVEMEFDECLRAVKAGTVDLVLLGMLEKAERKTYLDFTDAYYEPGRQILLVEKEEADDYSKLSDLVGKTVAAQYGSLQAQLVTEQLPESYMELTDSVTESTMLLTSGQADAVALDESVAEDLLKEYTELTMTTAEFDYAPEAVVGGVVKGETGLLNAVNKILKEVTEQKLYLNWLDAAIQQAAPEHSVVKNPVTKSSDNGNSDTKSSGAGNSGTTEPASEPEAEPSVTTEPASEPSSE